MVKKTFYVTTAIDYTNAKPHIGHAYEKICADVMARWHRLLGEDVFFLTGTDEHGQKVEEAAKKQGKKPKEFVDSIVPYFKDLLKKLNISNNGFIRTTEKNHIEICKKIFKKVYDKGDIYKGFYEGLYCSGCEAFYLEKDLVDCRCPVHQKKCETIKEESYFFKMSKYQDKVVDYITKNKDFIRPETRRNEILSRLKEPLRDLSVSRKSFKWGIPLPIDNEQVIYVWFDALLNYITALDYPKAKFKKYWPCDVHNIGKDILWFHSVIWPSILFSAGIEPPKSVFVHGFVNIGGEKLSKSSGLVVDPIKIAEIYGPDPLRYFLLREIQFGEDGNFSESALVERINTELANDLGNLVRRAAVMVEKYFKGSIPKQNNLEKIDKEFIKQTEIFKELKISMERYEFNKAIDLVWKLINNTNKYVNDAQPWTIKDKKRLGTVVYNVVEAIRLISIFIGPFIPETAEKIQKQFNFKNNDFGFTAKTKGKIKKAGILFEKVKLEEKFPLNLKVAKIIDVKDHPDADKLLVLKIDLGAERQIVAGLKEHYSKEELKGKNIVVVSNLKPAVLRGVKSEGMLLAAEKDNKTRILEANKSRPGDSVYFDSLRPTEKQISYEEFSAVKMKTKGKKVFYKDKALKTDKEDVFVDAEDGSLIR